jgi:hypothetical protein
VVRVDDRLAGEVPLVAASVPPPAPLEGTWWSRGIRALAEAAAGVVRGFAGA